MAGWRQKTGLTCLVVFGLANHAALFGKNLETVKIPAPTTNHTLKIQDCEYHYPVKVAINNLKQKYHSYPELSTALKLTDSTCIIELNQSSELWEAIKNPGQFIKKQQDFEAGGKKALEKNQELVKPFSDTLKN
jgi:hypothetical protein